MNNNIRTKYQGERMFINKNNLIFQWEENLSESKRVQ